MRDTYLLYKKVSEHPLKCVVINKEKNVYITFFKKGANRCRLLVLPINRAYLTEGG